MISRVIGSGAAQGPLYQSLIGNLLFNVQSEALDLEVLSREGITFPEVKY